MAPAACVGNSIVAADPGRPPHPGGLVLQVGAPRPREDLIPCKMCLGLPDGGTSFNQATRRKKLVRTGSPLEPAKHVSRADRTMGILI